MLIFTLQNISHQLSIYALKTLKPRHHSVYGLSQWETTLQCNAISHRLSPYAEWSLKPHKSRLDQKGNHFANAIFYGIFLKENICILLCSIPKFVQIHTFTSSHVGRTAGLVWVIKADSTFAFSQRETALLCNDVSHWVGANLESALVMSCFSCLISLSSVTFPQQTFQRPKPTSLSLVVKGCVGFIMAQFWLIAACF